MEAPPHYLRALYRSFLRELPTRKPSILTNPSPLQKTIRSDISSASSDKSIPQRVQEAEQYLHYIKSQRLWATLLERYNPGADMTQEERTRLTARRVGMNLPEEFLNPGGKSR